jgi:hypothetical protein
MPAPDSPISAAGLVADPPVQDKRISQYRAPVTERAWLAPAVPDATEKKLRRRARRQALALMVASSFVSVMALYGVWRLLHALI